MPVAKIRSYHALLIAATVCCSIGAGAAETAASKPPIVLILADDLGYGDLGCYGCVPTRVRPCSTGWLPRASALRTTTPTPRNARRRGRP